MIAIDKYDITQPSMRKAWKAEFHEFLIEYYRPSLVNADYVYKAISNVDNFIKKKNWGDRLLQTKDVDVVQNIKRSLLSHRSFAMGGTVSANDSKVIVLERYIEFLNGKTASISCPFSTDNQQDEDEQNRIEGRITEARILRRQRNRAARQKCLEDSGYTCYVCGFNFEKVYGEIGKDFLEVHHKKPLASYDDAHPVPQSELCALCSNCHSMVHHGKELLDVEELKRIYEENMIFGKQDKIIKFDPD